MSGASSVDPTVELAAVYARLKTLTDGACYMGVPQGFELPVDGFGSKLPYRDLEPGSIVRLTTERILAAHEQAQPHSWTFQIHHYAPTRSDAFDLYTASDRALLGWVPSSAAGEITPAYFAMYDEFSEHGERVGYIASRFYEVRLGQNPDLEHDFTPPTGYGTNGYGQGGYGQ